MPSCNDRYELSKADTQMAKGVAILSMVVLHLFCRLGDLPYTPLVYIAGKPLVYYFGVFGDMCVFLYCFCSGYAHYLLRAKEEEAYIRKMPRRLFGFLSNYWLVLILFAAIGVFFDNTGRIPGAVSDFLGNLLLYDINYNGAWWFVVTYVILTVLSPCLYWLASKIPSVVLILISGLVYFAAYLFRFKFVQSFDSEVTNWLWTQLILLGTSQFGYMLGMKFRKKRWISLLRTYLSEAGEKHAAINMLVVHGLPVVMFLIHCIEPSSIVAPITGLGTIICFWMWKKPQWAERAFLFFGKHSTNIWLVHMFFYSVLFKDFIFMFEFPALILAVMLGLTVAVSMMIQFLHSKAVRLWKRVYTNGSFNDSRLE